MAALAACKDYRQLLAPKERGQLQVIAASMDQAALAFNFIAGVFDASEALRGLVEAQSADTLRLASGIDIVVRPAKLQKNPRCDMRRYYRGRNFLLES
jgi:hypothetical protein